MTEPLLLKPQEVADRLGVGKATVHRMIRAGQLPYVLVGTDRRVPTRAVEEWVHRSTVPAR